MKNTIEHQGPVYRHDFGGAANDSAAGGLSNNISELVGFIHALRWARSPEGVDFDVCFRHDSKYAALVSCGVYRVKKNKALGTIAREEWKLTAAAKKAASKGMWIRHVKGHSKHHWNDVADKLAGDGNFKQLASCGPPRAAGARQQQRQPPDDHGEAIDFEPLVGGHS